MPEKTTNWDRREKPSFSAYGSYSEACGPMGPVTGPDGRREERTVKPTLDRLIADIAQILRRIEDYLPKAGSLERLLVQAEVADLLRLEPETLEAWRSRGNGPVYVKFGRDVRYRPSDILRFIQDRVCRSTWEHGRRQSEPASA